MTQCTELIETLRTDALFWEAPITCRNKAADAIAALEAELSTARAWLKAADESIEQLKAQLAAAKGQDLIEVMCARIKAADDAMADCDYMLDSADCISVIRGTWKPPMLNDKPAAPIPEQPANQHTALQAQPERVPLDIEEINAEARDLDDAAMECGFRSGVRWAEKRHGIKQGGQHD